MSGATTELSRASLIPDEVVDNEESKVCLLCLFVHMLSYGGGILNVDCLYEWIYGLPRGGLPYYLNSPENGMILRKKICEMYGAADFVLVPTFKTYVDVMKFVDGVKNRKESDKSPRRPLTALTSPGNVYRYVFIPCNKAAHALRKRFGLRPQTYDDLNEGIFPLDGKPCVAGSDRFPVLESRAHPFSVSVFADKVYATRRRKPLTDQWRALVRRIVDQWQQQLVRPPQWFVDEPKLGDDDSELSATEATGYCPLPQNNTVDPKPFMFVNVEGDNCSEHHSKKVGSWIDIVDPNAPDPNAPLPSEEEYSKTTTVRTKQSLQRSPLKLRRSHRLRAKACPYASASPDRCPYPPSPPRRVASALRYRDILRNPPAWVKRNGEFPTPTFSSNDWAYFSHRIALNAPATT
ncbi:hypothetical protein BD626DRAFT_570976 [Schizophyllum amplum]|uniref:Uncharacterized protein n=1 Tax=Schizophyllum amplum TaxID=97359 RepID=A0A550C947_9AGAR|nr:hypothetical protein BD626DRAFT_570976 [Auriculariopsis ampla]